MREETLLLWKMFELSSCYIILYHHCKLFYYCHVIIIIIIITASFFLFLLTIRSLVFPLNHRRGASLARGLLKLDPITCEVLLEFF